MAEDERKSAPGIGANSAIIVALVATGAFFYTQQAPLTVSRPPPLETHIQEKFQAQDVESRLWQDPFDAVAREVEKADSGSRKECDDAWVSKQKPLTLPLHCRSPLVYESGEKRPKPKDVRLIGVTAPGASYFEDAEARRRLRYAVLSGLQLEGYEPQDALHIGYFRPAKHDKGLPAVIPYEWFERPSSPQPVLLLWIDEDVLADTRAPLERVKALRQALCAPANAFPCPKMKILGPYSSGVLRDLATEMDSPASAPDGDQKKKAPQTGLKPKEEAKPENIRFFSFSATISDADLKAPLHPERIIRTIAQDDVLARAIGLELRRRRIYPGSYPVFPFQNDCGNCRHDDHVALISDRDTLYGRTIVDAFIRELRCPDEAHDKYKSCLSRFPVGEPHPEWIHRRAYLRGLDGMLPATNSSGDKSSKKDNGDKEQGESSKAQQSSKTLERAFGQGQFDYLRRLAASLKDEDDALKRDGKGGIRAIGVLGNDVFDKLLVLRALKPLFPEAVFFTTDYDAALAGQDELEWSRNLIVASSYGPMASREYQKDIPPFRSTYQTAAFLAARVAAKDDAGEALAAIEKGLASARLFEIDRRGEFIPLPTEKISTSDAKETNAGDIHPKMKGLYPALAKKSAASFAVVLSIGAIILFSFYRNGLLSSYLKTTWWGLASIMLLAAITFAAWGFVADRATGYGLGEPIAWAQGVSMWPSIALRAIAAVMAAVLIRDAWTELNANLEDIESRRLKIGAADGIAKTPNSGGDGRASWHPMGILGRALSYRLIEEEAEKDKNKEVFVNSVWKEYVAKQRLRPVAIRIAFYVLVMLYISLVLAYGWPNIPWRGPYGTAIYYGVTIPAVLALFILVFLVFDSTLLCLRFIEVLRRHKTHWPDSTRAKYAEKLKIDGPLLDDWIDLRFMALRTRCISKLVYYPFAIFALMIVSRSAAFAGFAVSPPIVITQFVGFIALFGCAMALCF
ncbi:MAG: hypothetical protein FJX16_02955, partial [Alphaproteobacteria bacterium]|nr:hypothetical protein [Alphaproteobacteria bacterium]